MADTNKFDNLRKKIDDFDLKNKVANVTQTVKDKAEEYDLKTKAQNLTDKTVEASKKAAESVKTAAQSEEAQRLRQQASDAAKEAAQKAQETAAHAKQEFDKQPPKTKKKIVVSLAAAALILVAVISVVNNGSPSGGSPSGGGAMGSEATVQDPREFYYTDIENVIAYFNLEPTGLPTEYSSDEAELTIDLVTMKPLQILIKDPQKYPCVVDGVIDPEAFGIPQIGSTGQYMLEGIIERIRMSDAGMLIVYAR
ncbi:MAG: hypothetical protein LBS32_00185 [Clostridiales Family XIII bacterium]|jgi:hypothetical protein|nr:hypothetical protein [Clostridiales Family XIII bacterium]